MVVSNKTVNAQLLVVVSTRDIVNEHLAFDFKKLRHLPKPMFTKSFMLSMSEALPLTHDTE